MAHSYTQNILHVVFSTKDRARTITPEMQPRRWAYIGGICRKEDIPLRAIGGMEDHLHLLLQLPATYSLAKTILTIKANSSSWLRESSPRFAWQKGYGAFSVSSSLLPTVERYIHNQRAHHYKISFEDELCALLQKHGVAYDSKYVFG